MVMASLEFRIAAIVNSDVISSLDLEERIDLALGTSGQPNVPEIRQRAVKKLLQSLIDESLRLQEAKRFSIMIAPEEIDRAIASIEQKQGKTPGSLIQFIQSKDLSVDSFRQQIRSQIAWKKLLARKVRRDIVISDDEVVRAQKRIAQGKKVKEVQIAAIVLPYDEAKEPKELLGVARDIRSQLLAGADPTELLPQYQDRVRIEFGPMTWVPKNQLNPVLAEAIRPLKKGQIAEPVPTPLGFQIIRLLDERTISTAPLQNAEVALKQIVLKLDNRSSEIEIDSKMDIARSISKHPGSCTEMGVAGLKEFAGLRIDVNYIRTTLSNMAPDVRTLVEPLPVTGITKPFASKDGIHLLMLCERISLPAPLPDKMKVREALFDEKMQLEAEKYLRKLRREAFLDIRV